MISVKCACGAKFNAKDDRAGKEFDCPKCGKRVRVPAILEDDEPLSSALPTHSRQWPTLMIIAALAASVFGIGAAFLAGSLFFAKRLPVDSVVDNSITTRDTSAVETLVPAVDPVPTTLFVDPKEPPKTLVTLDEGRPIDASRAPNGKTVLRHDSDMNEHSRSKDSKKRLLPEALVRIRDRIKKRLEVTLTEIDHAKLDLKRATIADDKKAIDQVTKAIKNLQLEIENFIDGPLSNKPLSLQNMKTGDIGSLPFGLLKVLQVTDKANGEALIVPKFSRIMTTFKVVGVDATNMTDGGDLRNLSNCFIVVGTETYDAVSGGTRTIFRLESCDGFSLYTDAEINAYRRAQNETITVELNAEELAQRENNRLANIEAKSKVELAKKQEEAEKERLMKARRSQSNLDSAKLLIKKDQRSAAKKFLEKAVADDPDSDSGKEAAKLLEDFR